MNNLKKIKERLDDVLNSELSPLIYRSLEATTMTENSAIISARW